MRQLLRSKIHHARVTDTNLYYEGSLFIDSYLLEESWIVPWEKVEVNNVNNWNRWSTYVVPQEKNSGIVSINWWSARLCTTGDLLIIMAFEITELDYLNQNIILLDENNKIKEKIT